MIHGNDITMINSGGEIIRKWYLQCKFVVEVCLIHKKSYSFAIHSTTFLVKILIDHEFLTSDGIVFHITGPEYDKLLLNKLILGFETDRNEVSGTVSALS